MARYTARIEGLRHAVAALSAVPDVTREAVADAAEDSAEHVRAGAVLRVPVRYGFLRKHIGVSISRKTVTARVGITKGTELAPNGKAVDPRRYAHLVEFGGLWNDATHFMLRSAEEERPRFIQRCYAAGRTIENIGKRFL